MTDFINAANIATAKEERKETVFNQVLCSNRGWRDVNAKPQKYEKVLYLGKCKVDGDMFACTTDLGAIVIFKGTKGDEFND